MFINGIMRSGEYDFGSSAQFAAEKIKQANIIRTIMKHKINASK